jgi:hypothetical protein
MVAASFPKRKFSASLAACHSAAMRSTNGNLAQNMRQSE